MVQPIPRHVTRNWTLDAFREQEDRNVERQRRRQEEGIDAAYRAGLSEMYGPEQGPVQAPGTVAVTGAGAAAADVPQPGSMGEAAAPAAPQVGLPQRQGGGVPTSMNPILRRLVAQQGGGQGAMQIHQQQAEQQQAQQRREEEMEQVAIRALGSGDLETFRYYQQRLGLRIPENIVNDARARRDLSVGAQLAFQFYREDPAQAQRFAAAYLQSGGDAQAAWQAAGRPYRRPNVSLQTVEYEGQRLLARMGEGGNFLGFVQGPGGQPLQADSGVGAAGRTPAAIAEAQILATWIARAEGREPTHQDMVNAYQTANMAKENPQAAAANLASRLMGQTDMAGRPIYTPEQAQQMAVEMVQGFRQSFGGGAYGGLGGFGQQAPQQQQEPGYDFDFDPETGEFLPFQPGGAGAGW